LALTNVGFANDDDFEDKLLQIHVRLVLGGEKIQKELPFLLSPSTFTKLFLLLSLSLTSKSFSVLVASLRFFYLFCLFLFAEEGGAQG
jgi:hypothetical protein